MCSCESSPAAPAAPGVRDQTPSLCLRTPTEPFRLASTGSVCWQGFLGPGVGLCSEFMFGSGCWEGGAGDRARAVHGAPRAAPPSTQGVLGVSEGSGPKLPSFVSLPGRRSCLEKPLLPVCEGQRHFPKPCRGSSSHWHMAGEARTWTPGL